VLDAVAYHFEHGFLELSFVFGEPYHIIVLRISGNGLREQAVNLDLCASSGLIDGDLPGVVEIEDMLQ
jgi:hypothetical protein